LVKKSWRIPMVPGEGSGPNVCPLGLSGWLLHEKLKLLMQGYTTRQIASRMHISPNTAKTFLRFVMFKTGAYDLSGVLAKILQISKDDAVNRAHPYERLMAI